MYNRLLKINPKSKESCLLLGPRGTGKTHWITHHLPDALVFNLLKTATFAEFIANPSRLENHIPPNFQNWIVIDEVQKIPALLNEVHRLIESKGYKFLLTGSSARKLKREGANLLAGRALSYTMHPLTCRELGDDFSLDVALKFGLLPKVYSSENAQHYLKTYIGTYLQEEILQEGILRNIGEFSRFLEVASFSQGEVLNMSEVAREAGIKQKIVSTYFQITEDLLIGFKVPIFMKRAQRQLIAHPKFYFFDVGVYRAIRPTGPLDLQSEIDGRALETLFVQHLRAINDYLDLGYTIYYWRTRNGLEVDFVVYGENGLIAFEIKRKRKISTKDLRGLRTFSNDYPMAKLYLLYGGEAPEYHDNITALPILEGLKRLPELLNYTTESTDTDNA